MNSEEFIKRREFDVKDTVYIKGDPDQSPRIVIGIYVTENEIRYDVSNGTSSVFCYGFQLSAERTY